MKLLKFLLLLIPIVGGLVIDCEYKLDTWGTIGDVYMCRLKSNPSITSYGTVVTGAYGNHLPLMNYLKLSAFQSDSESHTINYMPRGLTKVFPNLIAIYINSGRIKELYQDDLKGYTKLQSLDLDHNDIRTLEINLFKFNPELKVIRLYRNKIKEVHPAVFDNLNQLQFLGMSDNDCVTGVVNSKSKVLELIKKVQKQCLPNDLTLDLFYRLNNHDQQFAAIDEQTKRIEDSELTITNINQTIAELKQQTTVIEQNMKADQELKQENNEKFAKIQKQIFDLNAVMDKNIHNVYDLIMGLSNEIKKKNNQNIQGYVEITKVEVRSEGSPDTKNLFTTFMDSSKVDVSLGMAFASSKGVQIEFDHLNHWKYTLYITINNETGSDQTGTIRVFLAPKYNERGEEFIFNEHRSMMAELDKFKVNLRKGNNDIKRMSSESSVIIPYKQIFKTSPPVSSDAENPYSFCGCGWPEYMLIPKGTGEKFPCVLFVMVTDHSLDFDPDSGKNSTGQKCKDAAAYCGLRDIHYPDKRAMGFPFDRIAEPKTKNSKLYLKDFITKNMKTQDVKIVHSPIYPIVKVEP